jgi:hypothetical protein
MPGQAVQYTDALPTGSSVIALNNNDVVFSIARLATGGWADYSAFVNAEHKSVLMSNYGVLPPVHIVYNDEHCLEADIVNGGKKIKDFTMSGLDFPKTHTIRITITYGEEAIRSEVDVNVFGAMDIPVVKSAKISPSDARTAIVEVWPHMEDEEANKLLTGDIHYVSITAITTNALSELESVTYDFDLTAEDAPTDGKYAIPSLVFDRTYSFFVEMTNSTGNKVVSAANSSNNVSLYIVDTTAFPTSYLSAAANEDGLVTVTIASFSVPYVLGSDEEKEAQRPTKITLLCARVPTNILDAAAYTPTTWELSQEFTEFDYDEYDAEAGASNFAGDKFEVAGMSGRTLKFKAAFTYGTSATPGSYCGIQSLSVDADTSDLTSESIVQGLLLVGIEYRVEKNDEENSEQPNIIGEWSCDDELIIAGSKTGKSITVAVFDGIEGEGLTKIPTVTLRQPVVEFIHGKKESPYHVVALRGVFAKVGDFSWAGLTASSVEFGRDKLTLSGTNLRIDGKQWLALAKANIKSEWQRGDVQVAVVDLADCVLPSVSYGLDAENTVYGSFTVSEVAAHTAFAAGESTADETASERAQVSYIIKNPNTGQYWTVERDEDGKLTKKDIDLERGSKNYFVLFAEVEKEGQLIGKSSELKIPNLDIIPGEERSLSGSYTCDPRAITSGLLEHAAGVGASFAIEYDGRLSVDQDVSDHPYDDLYTMDYKVYDIQCYDTEENEWVSATGSISAVVSKDDEDKNHYACFRITGLTGLKEYRVKFARQYMLKSNNTIKILDTLPEFIEFTPTLVPNTPIFSAIGSTEVVRAVFANGAADSEAVIEMGLRNDLYKEVNGEMEFLASADNEESEFIQEVQGVKFVWVSGARSYANPNPEDLDGLSCIDGQRVTSVLSARTFANTDSGVEALTGVSVSTVYTPAVAANPNTTPPTVAAAAYYRTKFICNAPATDGAKAEVHVYYDAEGFDADKNVMYELKEDKDDDTKVSFSIDPEQLRQNLGLTPSAFLDSVLKCVFTASKEYSHVSSVSDLRRSTPVAIDYEPKVKPTLSASDFLVTKQAGSLLVTTGALSKLQLGGNSTLTVKVIAASTTVAENVYGNGNNETILIGEEGLSQLIDPDDDTQLYKVSVVIQSSEFVGETTIDLGTYKPSAALAAVVTDSLTVNVGSTPSSLVATWVNLNTDQLGGWGLSSRRIYVSNTANNVTKYYITGANGATTTTTKTVFKPVSASSVSETLSGLPLGIEFKVMVEATYTKTGESPQIVNAYVFESCAGAPIFHSFRYVSGTNTVSALINQNGSTLHNFWLFAKYDGAQGEIYFPIDISSLTGEESNVSSVQNCLFTITMPSGVGVPKPSGVMGILMNEYGAVVNGSPASTFGAPAAPGTVQYNSTTDATVAVAAVTN